MISSSGFLLLYCSTLRKSRASQFHPKSPSNYQNGSTYYKIGSTFAANRHCSDHFYKYILCGSVFQKLSTPNWEAFRYLSVCNVKAKTVRSSFSRPAQWHDSMYRVLNLVWCLYHRSVLRVSLSLDANCF